MRASGEAQVRSPGSSVTSKPPVERPARAPQPVWASSVHRMHWTDVRSHFSGDVRRALEESRQWWLLLLPHTPTSRSCGVPHHQEVGMEEPGLRAWASTGDFGTLCPRVLSGEV